MRTFKREHIHTHCVGAEWPEFLGEVALGESFVVETERFNLANGPVAVAGVRAGDDIASWSGRVRAGDLAVDLEEVVVSVMFKAGFKQPDAVRHRILP